MSAASIAYPPAWTYRRGAHLVHRISSNDFQSWSTGTIKNWLAESRALAMEAEYKDLPMPPAYHHIPATRKIRADNHYTTVKDIELLQLKRAGVRLAMVLNDALK